MPRLRVFCARMRLVGRTHPMGGSSRFEFHGLSRNYVPPSPGGSDGTGAVPRVARRVKLGARTRDMLLFRASRFRSCPPRLRAPAVVRQERAVGIRGARARRASRQCACSVRGLRHGPRRRSAPGGRSGHPVFGWSPIRRTRSSAQREIVRQVCTRPPRARRKTGARIVRRSGHGAAPCHERSRPCRPSGGRCWRAACGHRVVGSVGARCGCPRRGRPRRSCRARRAHGGPGRRRGARPPGASRQFHFGGVLPG
jgi:hypothetical protein